mmetsp:Transcript_46475/g.120256  ORF Transcript_46475/g.120256 Transcript_46475/m.120256 type:complete len:202 (+) Transcript_46475:816-1421(+)
MKRAQPRGNLSPAFGGQVGACEAFTALAVASVSVGAGLTSSAWTSLPSVLHGAASLPGCASSLPLESAVAFSTFSVAGVPWSCSVFCGSTFAGSVSSLSLGLALSLLSFMLAAVPSVGESSEGNPALLGVGGTSISTLSLALASLLSAAGTFCSQAFFAAAFAVGASRCRRFGRNRSLVRKASMPVAKASRVATGRTYGLK